MVTPFRIIEGYQRPTDSQDLLYQNSGRFVTELVDPQKTDQYALGLIALEMVAGKRFWEIFEELGRQTKNHQPRDGNASQGEEELRAQNPIFIRREMMKDRNKKKVEKNIEKYCNILTESKKRKKDGL